MKRIVLMFLACLMTALSSWADVTPVAPTLGDGSESKPYQLRSEAEFLWFRDQVNSGNTAIHARLAVDVNLADVCGGWHGNWEPIGKDADHIYSGTFDGGGHVVKNLSIEGGSNGSNGTRALFGHVSGTVKQLTVSGNISGDTYLALVVARCEGTSSAPASVINCQAGFSFDSSESPSSVSGVGNNVAGVIGFAAEAIITDCRNYADVTQTLYGYYTGGICGRCYNTQAFERCANYGAVTSKTSYVGGVTGYLSSYSSRHFQATDIANYGDVKGGNLTGCITGYSSYINFSNCFNCGSLTSTGNYGVFSGCTTKDTFTHCYSLFSREITGTGTRVPDPVSSIIQDSQVYTGAITCQFNLTSDAWGQKLGDDGDIFPVLGGTNKVYITNPDVAYFDCPATLPCEAVYTNDLSQAGSYASITTTHHWNTDLELCTTCHLGTEPATETIDGATYYCISKVGHLAWFRDQVYSGNLDANAILKADIDLSPVCSSEEGNWTPIGRYQNAYKGTFNGDGHTISNLYFVDRDNDNGVGLFGYIDGATITNLKLSNVYIDAYNFGNSGVAALVGFASDTNRRINNISYIEVDEQSSISGAHTGGIIGTGYELHLHHCINRAAVTGGVAAGGIGEMLSIQYDLVECHNFGSISGKNSVGGIAARVNPGRDKTATYAGIVNCANYGNVSSYNSHAGGLLGYLYNTDIVTFVKSCLSVGDVMVETNQYAGKFIGMIPDSQAELDLSNNYICSTSSLIVAGESKDVAIGNSDELVNSWPEGGFSNGAIASMLQAFNPDTETTTWGQLLGQDPYPCTQFANPLAKTVYTITTDCQGHSLLQSVYTNIPGYVYHSSLDADGLCNYCNKGAAPEFDAEGYCLIANAGNLVWLSEYVKTFARADGTCTINARQTADIDLSSVCNYVNNTSWNPIGYEGTDGKHRWAGIYDGQGHKVTGLYINRNNATTGVCQGLFGVTAPTAEANSKICNLSVTGQVTAYNTSGILVGAADQTDLINVKTDGSITGIWRFIGGVAGVCGNCEVTRCSNEAMVLNRDGVHTDQYNTSTTRPPYGYAGIVGSYTNTEGYIVSECFNSGTVDAGVNCSGVGGIIGRNTSSTSVSLVSCANVGSINGGNYTAGLDGGKENTFGVNIWATNCYNYGNVTSEYSGTDKCFGPLFAVDNTTMNTHAINCTYLISDDTDPVIFFNVMPARESSFDSGAVAYQLTHGEVKSNWGQSIDLGSISSPYPVLYDYPVYQNGVDYSNFQAGVPTIGALTTVVDRQLQNLPHHTGDVESVQDKILGGYKRYVGYNISDSDKDLFPAYTYRNIKVEHYPDNHRIVLKSLFGANNEPLELTYNDAGDITAVNGESDAVVLSTGLTDYSYACFYTLPKAVKITERKIYLIAYLWDYSANNYDLTRCSYVIAW